ncbi:MAG: hypothetical protein NTV86_18825 [Planctomycetota bacterium]|nr:hypothetical protein [Planctomycetota bacterium]
MEDFQSKHATSYTAQYATEPPVRPPHIPTTYADPQTRAFYTVIYDQRRGGYGYYVGSDWYFYDAMRDAVMLDMLMDRHGYVYGPRYYGNGYGYSYGRTYAPAPAVVGGGYVHASSGWSALAWLGLIVLTAILAILVLVILVRLLRPREEPPVSAASREAADPPMEPAPAALTDPADRRFWRQDLVDYELMLTDPITMQVLAAAGRAGAPGMAFRVKQTLRLRQVDGLAQWRLVRLAGADSDLWLKVLMVDGNMDVGVFYQPAPGEFRDFRPGTRAELIADEKANCRWLFGPPANPASFDPADLDYTADFTGPLDDGRTATFARATDAMLCDCAFEPPQEGVSRQKACLAEYAMAPMDPMPVEDTDAFILELGEGSTTLVQFFRGYKIQPAQVTFVAGR